MLTKTHDIVLKLIETDYIDTGIKIVQNDALSHFLRIKVSDGFNEINYGDIDSAIVVFAKQDGNVVQGNLTKQVDRFTYSMGTNEIAYPGVVLACVQLMGPSGQRLTTSRFKFTVIEDLLDPSAVESSTEFAALQQAMEILDTLEQKLIEFPNIKILGTFDTATELESTYPDGSELDGGFFVLENGEFYIWSLLTNGWESLGSIRGPQGEKGDTGDQGVKGDTGTVPNIQIGTVTTLQPGNPATVTRQPGSPDEAPILNFAIPKGIDGAGAGDMTKDVYDPDNVGVVIDSRKLGGQLPAYYAKQADLESHLSENTQEFLKIFNNSTYLTKIINKMQRGLPVKIVCYGDSVFFGDNGTGAQTANPIPQTLQTRLRTIYNNNNITVVNNGTNGLQSDEALSSFDSIVISQNPDLVIIMFGINDISGYIAPTNSIDSYKTNITTMVTKCIPNNINVLLLTPTFTMMANGSNTLIEVYGECVKEIAKIYSIPCIDMCREQEKLYLSGSNSIGANMVDGAHFTDIGYKLTADIILQKALDPNMGKALNINNKVDLFVPAVSTKYIKTDGTFINSNAKQYNVKNYTFSKNGTYGTYLSFEFYITQSGMDLFLLSPQATGGGILTVVDNGVNLPNKVNFYAEEVISYDVPNLVYENIPLGYHKLEFKTENLIAGDATTDTTNPFMYISMFKFKKTELYPNPLDKYIANDTINYATIEKFTPIINSGICYNSQNTYNVIVLNSEKSAQVKDGRTLVIELEGYLFDKCGVSWFGNIAGNNNTQGINQGYVLVFGTNGISLYHSGVNNGLVVFTNSTATVALNYANTHKVRIEHTYAGLIKVFVDGTLQITCTSKRYNSGYFGLYNQPVADKSMQLSRFEYAYV